MRVAIESVPGDRIFVVWCFFFLFLEAKVKTVDQNQTLSWGVQSIAAV